MLGDITRRLFEGGTGRRKKKERGGEGGAQKEGRNRGEKGWREERSEKGGGREGEGEKR